MEKLKSYNSVQHASCTHETWASELQSALPSSPRRALTLMATAKKALHVLVVSATAVGPGGASPSSLAKLANKGARVVARDAAVKYLLPDSPGPDHISPSVIDTSSGDVKFFLDESLSAKEQGVHEIAFRVAPTRTVILSSEDTVTWLSSLCASGKVEMITIPPPATVGAEPVKSSQAETNRKTDTQAGLIVTGKEGTGFGVDISRAQDFSGWYTQVLKKSEMLEYYDVSGCYIIRPWAFSIWKAIQAFLSNEFEQLEVEDCYFPMFVSARALEREKDHVEGFAPEVAWVTKAGNSELNEHLAIRPTSETVMYPAYANWIKSHRDLPLKMNQWCNVVRWEFKHPQPFLRTREILWQEGHTAFTSQDEADREVRDILDLYRRVYEELLAVPVVPGRKSEKEKFAGALYTTTVEGFIPTTGRAIQGATSHALGQNFSKMFNILCETADPTSKERAYVWQNSWGITTRTIGVMIMVHGDDKGLVLPPRVASIQVVVIAVGKTAKTSVEEAGRLDAACKDVVSRLKGLGVRIKFDSREHCTPGYKFNHWEIRGVPLRLEIGPKDLKNNSTRAVLRMDGSARAMPLASLETDVPLLLKRVQSDMLANATAIRDERLVRVEKWEDGWVRTLDGKNLILSPWCEKVKCEEDIKNRSARGDLESGADEKAPSMGAKSLCIPFSQPVDKPLLPGKTKCFLCDDFAKSYTLFGRSY